MAFLHVKNVRIAGISCAVPKEVEENATLSLFKGTEAESFMASTGVERRHVSMKHLTSDLCYVAAERLIKDLGWKKEEVDAIILVTQSPDYLLPATSCILQNRLGLSEECYSLDISLGCSGWVYGLSTAAGLLSSGMMKKALLMAGDTEHTTSPEDKSAYPLFGEAGSVTALEYLPGAEGFKFHFATDGSGYEAILIPDGGFRNPFSELSLKMEEAEPGIRRTRLHTILNGMDVFSFGITKAPESVGKVMDHFSLVKENIDYFVFHQANKFMNDKIRKKLKIDPGKVPYSLKNYGNTSSASIPLTMVTEISEDVRDKYLNIIACGFGVGLSWATVHFSTDLIICPEIIEV